MKKLVVLLMIAVFAAVGCTGTFKLTRQVYDFQTKPADKWVDEVLFLAFVIVPVYGVATLVDAVVFNSIEFWTGKNPMTSGTNDSNNVIAQRGNSSISMNYDETSRNIEVTSPDTGKSFILAKTDSGVVAKDTQGKVLFTSVEDPQGGVTVLDANNRVIKQISPQDVEKQRLSFFTR